MGNPAEKNDPQPESIGIVVKVNSGSTKMLRNRKLFCGMTLRVGAMDHERRKRACAWRERC